MSEQSTALHTPFAKITRPHYASVLPRKRLFSLLDDRRHPVIWVCAPPGAGKTALISSYIDVRRVQHLWYQLDQGDSDLPTFFHYLGLAAASAAPRAQQALPHLTAEYAAGVPAFARRYFEALAARIKPPCILVLDNYHEVSPAAQLHAALREGIAALPPGFAIVVTSRSEPPAELARLRVNDQLLLMGWDELRLTLEEVKGIEQLSRHRSKRPVCHEDLHEKTQGWVGGLVLLLAQSKSSGSTSTPQGASHQVLFDYFAGEVFANLEAGIQRALVASALLGKMTARSVAELTGFPAAGEILQNLNRRNYFTLRHDQVESVYEYHPLFRQFLLARGAQMLAGAELQSLRRKAAALLETDGQIEEAAQMLLAAGDGPGRARLICAHAPAFTEQGRGKVVEAWLESLPDDMLCANPWLDYWQGMCRLPFQPSRSRACFERAYAHFKLRGDLPGCCRAWCAIVDSLVFEWSDFKPLDRWIGEMDELLRAADPLSDAAIEAHVSCGMFLALMFRQPQHADMPAWEQRVRHVVLHAGDPQLQMKVGSHLLIYYTWWIGDLAKAELLVSTLRARMQQESVTPLMQTTWHTMVAAYYWMSAANTDCIVSVNRGIEIGQQTGVHAWDVMLYCLAVYASLSCDETEQAAAYLQRMEARLTTGSLIDKATYCQLTAWLRAAQGNLSSACEMLHVAVALAEDAGAPFPAAVMRGNLGAVLSGTGQRAAGTALIHQSRAAGSAMRSRSIEYFTSIAEAELAMDAGEEAACIEHLRSALAVGAQQQICSHVLRSSGAMTRLYARALAEGIETDYVAAVISKCRLAPPSDAGSPENWPWPIKIHTLGGFRILKGGQQVRFTGKSPRKPLELLKALIAFGSAEVDQLSLVDALWPELEGDNALRAFETALYRLRKLLADDAAITLKGGKLTLNAGCVWVDSVSVERLLLEIDAADAAGRDRPIDELASRLLSGYPGHFLPGESGAWAIERRKHLRNRFLHALEELARRFEAREAWEATARCYRRAVEIEPLTEKFSYQLMLCYQRQGQTAEALAVYRRCRQTLSSNLGIEPSAMMKALHSALAAEPLSIPVARPKKALS